MGLCGDSRSSNDLSTRTIEQALTLAVSHVCHCHQKNVYVDCVVDLPSLTFVSVTETRLDERCGRRALQKSNRILGLGMLGNLEI